MSRPLLISRDVRCPECDGAAQVVRGRGETYDDGRFVLECLEEADSDCGNFWTYVDEIDEVPKGVPA